MRTPGQIIACGVVTLVFGVTAFGQSSSDLFQGAVVGSTSGTLGASPDGLFGGQGFGGGEAGSTLFNDATVAPVIGTDPVHFLEFTVQNGPVAVTSISAFFGQDGVTPGSSRSVRDFTLIADTNGTPGFQATDAFVTSPEAVYVGNAATVTLDFFATASAFRLELDPFTTGENSGVRIYELDAVPEPASLSILALAAAALGVRRAPRSRPR